MTDTQMEEARRVVFPEPRIRKVLITPEIAMDFLSRADLNRPISKDRAGQLARAFLIGDYRLTGDAIVFTRYDLMSNGQHRMLAVVMANLSAEQCMELYGATGLAFWVMEGSDDDEVFVQDTGRIRSFADQLRVRGVKGSNNISAVTKLLMQYKMGTMGDLRTWLARLTPTVFELWRYFLDHEEIIKASLKQSDRVRKVIPFTQSVLATAWIILSSTDAEDAEGFWAELSMQVPQSEGIQMLQAYMLRQRKTGTSHRKTGWYTGIDSRVQLALLIKAWNHYRAGTTPKQIFFRSGGAAPEAFPVPR